MRVFVGCEEVASVIGGMSAGFRALGHEVTSMVVHPPRLDVEAGFDIVRGRVAGRWLRGRTNAERLIRLADRFDDLVSPLLNGVATPRYLEHDLFVFVWRPWLPVAILLPLLKRVGRRVVVYYLGSDVRHVSAFSQEYGVDTSAWGERFLRDPLGPKLQRIRFAERFADAIFSVPDQAGLQVRPYFHARLPVVVPPIQPERLPSATPLVVHAPSSRDTKGTSYVVKAVEELKAAGHRFDFELITGRPRSEVLALLGRADILVDELLLHGPGVLSAEAMLLGCAVATRTLGPSRGWSPPVLDVRPETVRRGLERLLTDVPHRQFLRAAGLAWARENVEPAAIARAILAALEGGQPEYTPRFFIERFAPPPDFRVDRLTQALTGRVVRRWSRSPDDDLALLQARGLG